MPADKTPAEVANFVKMLTTDDKKARLLPPDFFQMLLEDVGGPRAFSRIVADLLMHSSTAPFIRQKIITDMLRLMTHIETKSSLPPSLQDTPTDELEAMLADLMERRNAAKTKTANKPDGHSPGPERGSGPGVAPAPSGGPS